MEINPTELIDKTTKLFKQLGLAIPKVPDYLSDSEKEFPSNLADLSVDELMQKVSVYNTLFSYASWLTAACKAEVVAYERELKTAEARAFISSEGGVTERKNERDIDEKVIEVQNKLTVSEIRYELLKSLLESYDKGLFVLSRQLTVLQMDFR
jgi:septation ring formation regulator EzrA